MNTIILLPTYNERENIRIIVPKIFSLIPTIRIMVVDDHSPDGTADEVRSLQTSYPNLLLYERPKKKGLGRAYIDTFQKVLREYPDVEVVCTMDADMSHDELALSHMLAETKNHDLVIGSRYIKGGKLQGWEWHRRFLSACGNAYVRFVTRLPIHDCTSGFSCIRTSSLRRLDFSDLDTSGYAFLIYLKYKLWRQGARIKEFPITFKSRLTGESKISMNIIEEGLLLPWKLIMKKPILAGTLCPVCGQSNAYYWFTKNNCSVYRCTACALIFMHPLPDRNSSLYSQDYFCGAHHGFGYVNYDSDKNNDKKTFAEYLRRIEQFMPKRGRLLDIGAATGSFLLQAREHGWSVAGIEISDYAANQGRAKGLDLRTGTVESAGLASNSFDVITLWDVFEHVPDPHQTLDSVKNLLAPGGLIVMNLPDAGSLYARLAGKRWPLIIPPEHLHLFTQKNLRQLLEAHGFPFLLADKIGKTYTLAYIFQILHTVRRKQFWKKLSDWVRKTPLNRISIPIHLRDNMFIVAQKKQ